jgi:signal transduction histidine kinase
MLKEVSCKALEAFGAVFARHGVTFDQLVEGLPVTVEELDDKRHWLAWDVFAELCRRGAELAKAGEALYEDIAHEFLKQAPSSAFTRRFAGLFVSPERLARFFCLHGGQAMFPIVRPALETLGRHRLRWTLALPDGYADCPLFFRPAHWHMVLLPTLLGLPEARVTSTWGTATATYEIDLPRPATLWFRFKQLFRRFTMPHKLLEEEFRSRETELLASFAQLNESERKLRTLNANLEHLVEQKTSELVARNAEIQESRVQAAYTSGMAEIAGEVIHHVGNALNSAVVSLDVVQGGIRELRVAKLRLASAMLAKQSVAPDEVKLRQVAGYLDKVAESLEHEQAAIGAEAGRTRTFLDAAIRTVAAQNANVRTSGDRGKSLELVRLEEIVGALLKLHQPALAAAGVEIRRRIGEHAPVRVDRLRVMRVLLRLVRYSVEAMREAPTKVLDIEVAGEADRAVVVRLTNSADATVEDERAFARGDDLHDCGNSIAEMGGTIHLDGPQSIRLRFPAA